VASQLSIFTFGIFKSFYRHCTTIEAI